MNEKDGLIFEDEKQLIEHRNRFSQARNNNTEYIRGYSDGYQEGFNELYKQLRKEFELIHTVRPIEIRVSKEEFDSLAKSGKFCK